MASRPVGGRRRPWSWLPAPPAVAGLVAYALVAGTSAPPGWPAALTTGGACGVVAGVAVRRDRRREDRGRPPRLARGPAVTAALAAWLVLVGALVAFQLTMYSSTPRHTYPTVSSLASAAFDVPGVRVAAFLSWLWAGWYLVRR